MKKEIIDNVHAWISVGCPSGNHADFRIDEKKNRFICNYCEVDFTKEIKKIYKALKKQFENAKSK